MTWDNIEIDHVKAIYLFDVSKDKELKEHSIGKILNPYSNKNHRQKGTKFNFLDYQLHFIKAYHFLKLNSHEG